MYLLWVQKLLYYTIQHEGGRHIDFRQLSVSPGQTTANNCTTAFSLHAVESASDDYSFYVQLASILCFFCGSSQIPTAKVTFQSKVPGCYSLKGVRHEILPTLGVHSTYAGVLYSQSASCVRWAQILAPCLFLLRMWKRLKVTDC